MFLPIMSSSGRWLSEESADTVLYPHISNIISHNYSFLWSVNRWRTWMRHYATKKKVAGSNSDGFIGIFYWQFFRPHYGPGVDSASNRNEYQEYFLGGRGGRCVGLTTLPLSCGYCLEIWEPQESEVPRACTGIALPCFYSFLCYPTPWRWSL